MCLVSSVYTCSFVPVFLSSTFETVKKRVSTTNFLTPASKTKCACACTLSVYVCAVRVCACACVRVYVNVGVYVNRYTMCACVCTNHPAKQAHLILLHHAVHASQSLLQGLDGCVL